MKKKILSLLLAGAMVCGMAVPVLADDVETVSMLTYVDWYGEGLKAVESYINENSNELGFKLEIQQISGGAEGDEMVSARTATNDLPDILNTYALHRYFNSMGGEGKLIPLDGVESASEYSDSVLDSVIYKKDGVLYGMPLGTGYYYGTYYNKKVLEEAGVEEYPQSWEEFLDACEKVKSIGITPVYFSVADMWSTGIAPLYGFNKELKDRGMTHEEFWNAINTNQIKFSECEAFQEACEKAKELIDKGYVQETYLSDTYDMAQEALANGECAFYDCAHVVVSEIATKYPDKTDDIGGNVWPIYGQGENEIIISPPTMVGVTTAAKNPELAKKAVDFLCSAKAVEIYSKAQPGIFVNNKVTGSTIGAYEEQSNCPMVPTAISKYSLNIQTYLVDYFIGAKELEEITESMDEDYARAAEAAGDENWTK